MASSAAQPQSPQRGYDLVVIGSSTGGIEALKTLVAALPTDFAAALIIAQHLDPTQVSHLRDILARHTRLPVRIVVAHELLVPGVIYVTPADHDVEITAQGVEMHLPGDAVSTPSVNHLFSSAARTHGERLIGVILTGAGSNGASGAREVKAAGDTILIENPATAANAASARAQHCRLRGGSPSDRLPTRRPRRWCLHPIACGGGDGATSAVRRYPGS